MTAARSPLPLAAALLACATARAEPVAPARARHIAAAHVVAAHVTTAHVTTAQARPVAPARTAPVALRLEPGSTEIAFRAYGMGFLPIDGAFGRFSGTLRLDPADSAACAIEVEADVASLAMPDAAMTEAALGPDLLDAPRFPRFAYRGECRDGGLHGALTLHGVTRPLAFQVSREGGRFVATGLMRRAEWGMGARPLLAGPEVRIRFTTALPAALQGPAFQTPGRPG